MGRHQGVAAVAAAAVVLAAIGVAPAGAVVATPHCEGVSFHDDHGALARAIAPLDNGFALVRDALGEPPVTLHGHDRDGVPAPLIDGRRERDLTTAEGLQVHVVGGRVLVVEDQADRDVIHAFGLDGHRATNFGSGGELAVPADRRVATVVELAPGQLAFWLETPATGDDVRQLLLASPGDGDGTLVTVDPTVLGTRQLRGVVASGHHHVLVHTLVDFSTSTTRVDRIRVTDGTADLAWSWDPSVRPDVLADLDGQLLVFEETGGHYRLRLFDSAGMAVGTFGDAGIVDVSDVFLQVTASAPARDGRVLLAGWSPLSNPEAHPSGVNRQMTALMVDSTGRADVGHDGVFGPVLGGEPHAVAELATGAVVLVEQLDFNADRVVVLGPDGSLSTDCGPDGQPDARRLAGRDRYATAAAISAANVATADTVVVATGAEFPDALAGGAAAAALGAPVLLSSPVELPEVTLDELHRLRPSSILVLGGEKALSEPVAARLRSLPWGPSVDRVAGTDRYDTAVRLSRQVFAPGVRRAYVVTGTGFADALAAVPAAAHARGPILLVPGDTVPPVVRDELARLHPTEGVTIVGGPAAVGYGVDPVIRSMGLSVERLAGADRYVTAAAVAEHLPAHSGAAFVATGTGFADALSAGPVAGHRGAPLLLTDGTALSEPTRDAMAARGVRVVTVVGGLAAVAEPVVRAVNGVSLGYNIDRYADPGQTVPLTWDACQPIVWRWWRGESAQSDLAFIQQGLASVTAQTGMTFVYDGESAHTPSEVFDESAPHEPVVIGFEWLGPLEAGLAGAASSSPFERYLGGAIALNHLLDRSAGFDGQSFASAVLVHEAGHLLGLDHVGTATQLMTGGLVDMPAVYGAGDLAGLARTLDRSRCA